MKAISIKNPYAYDLVVGQKTLIPDEPFDAQANPLVEWRSWGTRYRGDLLICASASPKVPMMFSGHALGIVELFDCKWRRVPGTWDMAYAFLCRNPRPLLKPFPLKGQLQLYEVPKWAGKLDTGYKVYEFWRKKGGGGAVCRDGFGIAFAQTIADVEAIWKQCEVPFTSASPMFSDATFPDLGALTAFAGYDMRAANPEAGKYCILAQVR